MKRKDINLNTRIDQETSDALTNAAEAIDVPVSQIVREAVREKVAKLKKTHPKLKAQVETA